MDKRHFIDLLKKYDKGTASDHEKLLLYNYYSLFEHDPDIISLLGSDEKQTLKTQIKEAVWRQIAIQEDTPARSLKTNWKLRLASAAIIAGIIITAAFFLFNNKPHEKGQPIVFNAQEENRLIRLPDGSSVIVYAGSTLSYFPPSDNSTIREVDLNGQAYFDIKHDPSKPFIVQTGNIHVTVLGTAFNIKALPTEPEISVTVTRGKVRVSRENETLGIVQKNEQIVFNKEKEEMRSSAVNADNFLKWKEQDILFDDVTVAEAAGIIEERFAVKIYFRDSAILSNRFTTVFGKGEPLEEVMTSICEFNGARYTYDSAHRTVIISKRN